MEKRRLKKKWPLVLTLSTVLAFPAAAQNAMDLEDFDQYRKMLLPTLKKSLAPLKQTRDCVLKSTNSDQLNQCVSIMAAQQPGGAVMPRLNWSPDMSKRLAGDLDRSLRMNQTKINCLNSSDSKDVLSACMRREGF